ncbi:MAG TPA: hypothetical protein PKC18_14100, partial [Lacipirellulaceae bacterium]|nr:hypothetical protein [Lacipirellulaceae bacterium]
AWRVPDGWRPGAPRAMVDATFVVPYPGGEAELTVSSLPMGENWSEYLHQNVERWLGQLQQEALDGPTVEKLARTTPTAAGEATWFELVGTMQTSSGGAGGGAGLPADHPPIDGTAGAGVDATAAAESDAEVRPGSSGGLTYDAPADWKPGPASSMRKASFIVGAGGDLSVTTFPAHAQMADPRANAERWAGQVKLRNLTDEDLEAASRPVEVDGIAGQRFEFYSPAGVEPAEGLIAAMVVQGDLVWFFKLSGDRAVVEGQSEAFDRFLESVRLPAGS